MTTYKSHIPSVIRRNFLIVSLFAVDYTRRMMQRALSANTAAAAPGRIVWTRTVAGAACQKRPLPQQQQFTTGRRTAQVMCVLLWTYELLLLCGVGLVWMRIGLYL